MTTQKYCPSSGSEGMGFYEAFCNHCQRDAGYRRTLIGPGCTILANTMLYDIEDSRYPSEWIYSDEDSPVCTAFEQEKTPDEKRAERAAFKRRSLEQAGQLRLF